MNLFIFNDPITFTLTLLIGSPVLGVCWGIAEFVSVVVNANLTSMFFGKDDDNQDPPNAQET